MAEIALTDCGNAIRFARLFGDLVRYNRKSRKWLAWDGKRWDESGGEEQAQLYCRGVAIELWKELGGTEPGDKRKALVRHWSYTESAAGIRNLLFVAKSQPGVGLDPSELNQDPWLFNCLDGTVNLRTGDVKDHDPNDLITQLAPVECRPAEAPVKLWLTVLNQWFPNDPEMIDYLQRLAGMCLTGSIIGRCMAIFWGGGYNGKNIFLEALMGVMGDYASKASTTLLESSRRDEHPTEVADMWGKRLMFASEPKKGSKLKVATVKAITGDKMMKGRFMHGNFFDFKNTTKIIMATQHMPAVEEDTDAIWDRLHKIKWGQQFKGAKRDTFLGEKLLAERAGILQWAIAGCLEWQAAGCQLVPTAMIQKDTQEYRIDQNPLTDFIKDECVIGLGCFVPLSALYSAYNGWGGNMGSLRNFNTYVRDLGYRSKERKINTKTVKCWMGLGLCSK